MGIIKELFKPIINKYKGKVGEKKVERKLNPLIMGKTNHRQINNLIIVDESGNSHQIDHIEIRKNGIFCIETKNYIGGIYGSVSQKNWTQTLYNGQKNYFLNPIKQNNSHIYHLKKIIGNKYHIHSIIVMVQNNADKINIPYVINLDELRSYLDKFNDGTKLSDAEMDELYHKILQANSRISDKEHIRNIKNIQHNLQKGVCPRCGGKLVERSGKYGTFFGCSNYPKCKFTSNDR